MDAIFTNRLPTKPGPYVLVDGYWVRSIDVPVEHIASSGTAVLLASLAFVRKDGSVSEAPMFFKFDGGSKPRGTWLVFGHPFGEYLFAYAIHDYDWYLIYGAYCNGDISKKEFSKAIKTANKTFLEIHKVIREEFLGRGALEMFKNRLKYRAVNLYGRIKSVFK